jgi:hypothetical protein
MTENADQSTPGSRRQRGAQRSRLLEKIIRLHGWAILERRRLGLDKERNRV